MLFGLLLAPRLAAAQIDATGAWHIQLEVLGFPGKFDTTIVQTGTSLSILWYTGTVDTTTGAFHLAGVRRCYI